MKRNSCAKINLSLADHLPSAQKFDIVLANINKNIITGNFKNLVNIMMANSCLVISGLLETDEEDILNLAFAHLLKHIETKRREKWISLLFNNRTL